MSKVVNYGELKKTVTKEGTRIITIDEPCLIKISPIDLLVEAKILLDDTLGRMGITQKIIEEVKKGVDADHNPIIQDIIILPTSTAPPEKEEKAKKSINKVLSESQKNDMVAFLNTVLSDHVNEDIFPLSEIETVLKEDGITISLLEREFGSQFSFLLVEHDAENSICISKHIEN